MEQDGLDAGSSKEAGPMTRMRATNSRSAFVAFVPLLLILPMAHQSSADTAEISIDPGSASAFAQLALKGLNKEYPSKPEHVIAARRREGPESTPSSVLRLL